MTAGPPAGATGRAQTAADRRTYLEGGLTALACDSCGVWVRVKKTSAQQTSVQWSAAAVRGCTELADRARAGEPTALVRACGKLRDSIDRAAGDGRLTSSGGGGRGWGPT